MKTGRLGNAMQLIRNVQAYRAPYSKSFERRFVQARDDARLTDITCFVADNLRLLSRRRSWCNPLAGGSPQIYRDVQRPSPIGVRAIASGELAQKARAINAPYRISAHLMLPPSSSWAFSSKCTGRPELGRYHGEGNTRTATWRQQGGSAVCRKPFALHVIQSRPFMNSGFVIQCQLL